MQPYDMIFGNGITSIYNGDCRDVLPTLDLVDAVVTDPPYGLSFMGKGWDRGIPSVEFWEAVMGVMKPGAHLLAFGGTRTFHRLTCAIEDAGFEIRDCLMWVYGSGFPKSLDVSKAIDKIDAVEIRRIRDLKFTEWMRSTGITAKQINDLTDSNMGNHYLTDKEQPSVATIEMFDKLKDILPVPPNNIIEMMKQRTIESQTFAEREVVGEQYNIANKNNDNTGRYNWNTESQERKDSIDITVPSTDAAKEWEGWGTALKPAWEPIILARKPLVGTVANNVLEYGVGGLNIDGCRVEASDKAKFPSGVVSETENTFGNGKGLYDDRPRLDDKNPQGRWPANLIHDGSDEVVKLFPSPHGAGSKRSGSDNPKQRLFKKEDKACYGDIVKDTGDMHRFGDSGSAARFFYCAKASKKDRGEGNNHPTVKPIALMQYLCRLITPPGGVVLDPFMGSGSTLVAAQAEGFNSIGIDTEESYCEIAVRRLNESNT